jgi:hypothetical protein
MVLSQQEKDLRANMAPKERKAHMVLRKQQRQRLKEEKANKKEKNVKKLEKKMLVHLIEDDGVSVGGAAPDFEVFGHYPGSFDENDDRVCMV